MRRMSENTTNVLEEQQFKLGFYFFHSQSFDLVFFPDAIYAIFRCYCQKGVSRAAVISERSANPESEIEKANRYIPGIV